MATCSRSVRRRLVDLSGPGDDLVSQRRELFDNGSKACSLDSELFQRGGQVPDESVEGSVGDAEAGMDGAYRGTRVFFGASQSGGDECPLVHPEGREVPPVGRTDQA